MVKHPSVVTARSRRAPPVLICSKCLKRIDQGKKLKRSVKSEMKRRNPEGSRKPSRVVMTGCFGICPKRAVVIADGASLERGEYLLVNSRRSVAKAVEILTARLERA